MGWLTGISGILQVIYQLIKLAMSGYAAAKEASRRAREAKTTEAIQNGDTIGAEEGMGSDVAGVPSGIPGAGLRPRDPKP